MTNTAFDESRQDPPTPPGVEVLEALESGYETILTPEALRFAASLERRLRATRRELLECPSTIQRSLDEGATRAQAWQWIRHGASLDDGRTVDRLLVKRTLDEELVGIRSSVGEEARGAGRLELTGRLFEDLVTSSELEDFSRSLHTTISGPDFQGAHT